jgi:hypothetical protein
MVPGTVMDTNLNIGGATSLQPSWPSARRSSSPGTASFRGPCRKTVKNGTEWPMSQDFEVIQFLSFLRSWHFINNIPIIPIDPVDHAWYNSRCELDEPRGIGNGAIGSMMRRATHINNSIEPSPSTMMIF